MTKPVLPFLEVMIINACNLSCAGCTTFSDLKHQGSLDWEIGKQWLDPWIDRLDIQAIGLMGGEPMMNPDLENWLYGIRKLLPDAQIRFVTNGTLLHKHWKIFHILRELENTVFKISYHIQNDKLDECIDKIFQDYEWEQVQEFGINRYKEKNKNFRFQIAKPELFFKTFKGSYNNMEPHNNNPKDAFDMCVQKKCPLLYNGKIFKCGTLGLTPNMLSRFNFPNFEKWKKFIDNGIENNCNQADLERFVLNFGKPHAMCRQCPSAKDTDSIILHTETVKFK